jgi:hypothetical protein
MTYRTGCTSLLFRDCWLPLYLLLIVAALFLARLAGSCWFCLRLPLGALAKCPSLNNGLLLRKMVLDRTTIAAVVTGLTALTTAWRSERNEERK